MTQVEPNGHPADWIRVLLVAPSLEIVGGQSIQAHRLIRLLEREPRVAVAFCPSNAPLPGWLRRVKYLRTLVNFLAFLPRLLLRARRCDVIHIFTPAYAAYFLWTVPAMAVGKLLGRKVVLNYRDGRAVDHFRESRIAVRTLRLADAIVAPSGYLVEVFGEYGVAARSIPNILDTDRSRYRERSVLRPVFFTNRGLEPLYNVACVVRAFSLIQKSYPEAELTIAHDGPCRAALERQTRALGLRGVTFAGRVSQERMTELYDAADIYLMSPNIDNMPVTLLECFAAGLPIVSTDAGGIPFVVEHEKTGLLVPCDDAGALAAAACRLLADPAFALALTRRAHAECARYSGDAVGPQWLRMYAELKGTAAAASGPPPREALYKHHR